MQNHITAPFTKDHSSQKEHTISAEVPLQFPFEDNHLLSFSELAISQSIPEYPNVASTAELQRGVTDNLMSILDSELNKKQSFPPRSGIEMKYISKVTFQESDPEANSGVTESVIEEEEGSDPLEVRVNKREALAQKKALEEVQNNENSMRKGEKKQKLTTRIFKDTFRKKQKKKGKENQEEEIKRSPIRMKTLGDIVVEANEFNEKENEQINQVARPTFHPNTVVALGGSQMLDVAQEENPLVNGTKRIALEQSMRPGIGKTLKSRSADDNLLYVRKFSRVIEISIFKSPEKKIQEEIENEKITKPTEKIRAKSYGVVKFPSLAGKALPAEGAIIKDLLVEKERSLGEKIFQVSLLTFIYAMVFYLLMPLGIFFVANDYDNSYVLTYFNFAILGCIQGITEIILIQYVVDIPILQKIRDIEGGNTGLIDYRKYKVLSKFKMIGILVWTIGTQICIGVVIRSLKAEVDSLSVFIGLICNSTVGAVLWFLLILVQNPPVSENKKKLLNREL